MIDHYGQTAESVRHRRPCAGGAMIDHYGQTSPPCATADTGGMLTKCGAPIGRYDILASVGNADATHGCACGGS